MDTNFTTTAGHGPLAGDVVVQSFRPAAARRLGIDAATLRHDRRELVYISIVGFGENGPLAGRPVYDHVIQAMAGMASLQVDAPNGEPRLVRHGLVDKAMAHVLAQPCSPAPEPVPVSR